MTPRLFNSGCLVPGSPPRKCVHCAGSGLRATSCSEEAPGPSPSSRSEPGLERLAVLLDVGLSSPGAVTRDPTLVTRIGGQGRGVRQPPPSSYLGGSVAHRPASTGLHHTSLPPQGFTTFAGFSPMRQRVVWSRETITSNRTLVPFRPVTPSPWVCCLLLEHAPRRWLGFPRCRCRPLTITKVSTGFG